MDDAILSDDLKLSAHLARPTGVTNAPGVVLCHGFPSSPRGAAISGATFPELADRIAKDCGWFALAFNFRGSGGSEGFFSVEGWLADIGAAIDALSDRSDVVGVWLVGAGMGGSLALTRAATDPRVRGVAVLNAYCSFKDWVRDPGLFLRHVRRVGMANDPNFPPDVSRWAKKVADLDPVADAGRLSGRPLLVLHGSDDEVVPLADARRLADAGGPAAEMHMVFKAGHRLRHEPRAIAALLGWLDRQVY